MMQAMRDRSRLGRLTDHRLCLAGVPWQEPYISLVRALAAKAVVYNLQPLAELALLVFSAI